MPLLARLFKGFVYGMAVGIAFAFGTFAAVAVAKNAGFINLDPSVASGIVFAFSTLGGVGMEYSKWLEEKEKQ